MSLDSLDVVCVKNCGPPKMWKTHFRRRMPLPTSYIFLPHRIHGTNRIFTRIYHKDSTTSRPIYHSHGPYPHLKKYTRRGETRKYFKPPPKKIGPNTMFPMCFQQPKKRRGTKNKKTHLTKHLKPPVTRKPTHVFCKSMVGRCISSPSVEPQGGPQNPVITGLK